MASGRNLPLSLPRRVICDLMDFSQSVPFIPIERCLSLREVAEAREAAQPRPGWCALFVKGLAAVAARVPELRRAYVPFPTPHLYEHPDNLAMAAIERPIGEDQAICFGQIRTPERQPLADIEAHLRRYKEAPVESIASYRRTLRIAALPWPLRRLAWWHAYHSSGARRARYFGTFGISTVAAHGASLLFLRSPLTATLNYSPIDRDGAMSVRLNFDHRVLDGGTAARALEELERVLRGDVLAELRYLRALGAA
jgi:hypothetical protein